MHNPGAPGNGEEVQLLLLQKELTSLRGQPILRSWTENGYLMIDVVYRSALKPLGEDSG